MPDQPPESQPDLLSPLQTEVMTALSLPSGWQPLPGDVVTTTEAMLLEALEPISEWFTRDEPLYVGKHQLATVHGCEAHHVAEREQAFAWSVKTVRGTIVHKAIELLLNWPGEPAPGDIVDEAFARIVDDPRERASDFVASLSAAERAELRGAAVGAVTDFLECFPPLRPQWRPVVEHSVRYSMFRESVVLAARIDLALGLPGRKVILDLKTGRISTTHRDDLRYYALIETLRSRQPPRRLATYSLDAARLDDEEVTEGVLQAAVRRAADGITAIAELVTERREPTKRPGRQCLWCPIREECDEGQRHLRLMSGEDEDTAD